MLPLQVSSVATEVFYESKGVQLVAGFSKLIYSSELLLRLAWRLCRPSSTSCFAVAHAEQCLRSHKVLCLIASFVCLLRLFHCFLCVIAYFVSFASFAPGPQCGGLGDSGHLHCLLSANRNHFQHVCAPSYPACTTCICLAAQTSL